MLFKVTPIGETVYWRISSEFSEEAINGLKEANPVQVRELIEMLSQSIGLLDEAENLFQQMLQQREQELARQRALQDPDGSEAEDDDSDEADPRIADYDFKENLKTMHRDLITQAAQYIPGFTATNSETVEEGSEIKVDGSQALENQATSNSNAVAIAAVPGFNPTKGIRSRKEAIEMLEKVAEYFAQTEPHSPISYSIRQTIDWTNLKLPELWLKLLDGDTNRLDELSKRVGFQLPSKTKDNT